MIRNKKIVVETIVSSNIKDCKVTEVDGELHLQINLTGVPLQKFQRKKYLNSKEILVSIPLWSIPYLMRKQRTAIADWEIKENEFIERIKKAFNTEVQPTK